MRFPDPFTAPGRWYKGNLHTHTTVSDGVLEPAEVVRRYRQAGYHFLALSDHGAVTQVEGMDDPRFLLLLATEMDGDRSDLGEPVHVLGFGLERAGPVPPRPGVEEAIAWVKDHGGESLIAHPAWSGLVISDLLRWDGHLGLEVFNSACDVSIGKGYSAAHWDDALTRNRRMWGFAVDDAHHRPSDHHPVDTARAWVMVKAPALTREALLHSLREGLFYSSWGPAIRDIGVRDGVVTVRTSPVKVINFISQLWLGSTFLPMDGRTITTAGYRLQGHERYLRIECRDSKGRWAWSNPIFLNGSG
jgi:predicted metal-dependent phosphoesterase TrpH